LGIAFGDRKRIVKGLQKVIPQKDSSKQEKETKTGELELIERIGSGMFGDVFKAKLNNEFVAAKRLQAGDSKFSEDFYKEVDTLMSLRHPNVISFIGIFAKDFDKYLVIDFMNEGSVKSLLKNKGNELDPTDICFVAREISKGMIYLASKDIIHRDLRADNILVNEVNFKLWVKIGDFGLSRKVGSNQYYNKTGKSSDPIKWSAPEVFEGRASLSSDVWSFGILLWELFVLCKYDPFPELSNGEVKKKVSKGEDILPHLILPPEFSGITDIMTECLIFDGHKRATFNTICDKLVIVEDKIQRQGNKWPEIKEIKVIENDIPYKEEPYDE